MTRSHIAQILADLRSAGVEVKSLTTDSRSITPGDVFLAYPGAQSDGRHYIAAAVTRGAAAVLYESEHAQPLNIPVPNIAIKGLRELAAPLAASVYGQPSEQLWLVGVTGTNGKTSVTQWLAQALTEVGHRCAVIGTLGNGFPETLMPSPNTTPDAVVLQRDLARFKTEGATACAMEVSSIGLDQGRTDATRFSVAVLTNLTRDHLDYHGDMATYAAAKAKLFKRDELRCAVLNLDDAFGLELAAQLQGRVHTIGYTLTNAIAPVNETLAAVDLQMQGDGLVFELSGQPVRVPLIGRFNASNILAVIGVMRAADIDLSRAITACAGLKPPAGRMQTLGGRAAPLVVVDYAHTPDALEKVLQTLREVTTARAGELYCLFGCGGDRDAGKRPVMGRLAEELADHVVLTSDNPRNEDPMAILAAIRSGIHNKPVIEVDRSLAISQTIAAAAENDVILLAGKGHETYQEIAGVRTDFDDVLHAQRALTIRMEQRAC